MTSKTDNSHAKEINSLNHTILELKKQMADTNLSFKKAELKVTSQSEEINKLRRSNEELTQKLAEIQKNSDSINNKMMMQKFGKDELGRKMAEAEDRIRAKD